MAKSETYMGEKKSDDRKKKEPSGLKRPTASTIDEDWSRVLRLLQANLGGKIFNSWFGRMKLVSIEGGVVVHTVPTTFLKSWINTHYRDILFELWQKENSDILRVDIVTRSAVRKASCQSLVDFSNSNAKILPSLESLQQSTSQSATVSQSVRHKMDEAGEFNGSPLDPHYTFEKFIEGTSNRISYAAARSIAENALSAMPFNPLFIHANVGLGKTHLLQAIAWEAKKISKNCRVLYLTAEYFMWRFASAIRDQSALSFKQALREIDILLIDDMQFLQGKSIQQEFCHLINALIDSAKQIAVAADRPPAELESLDERVRSRLQGGAILEITRPDFCMRKAIIDSRYADAKVNEPTLTIPEDIRDYVAKKISSSGRDLEGAFNQLLMQHRFSDTSMTLDDLDKILCHLVISNESRRVRIEDIQKVVAHQFNISKNDLLSSRRTRIIVRPRQIAMYLAKAMTPRSLPEIGRRFGGRDHTTVLHAVRKIEELVSKDQKLAREIELLRRLIDD